MSRHSEKLDEADTLASPKVSRLSSVTIDADLPELVEESFEERYKLGQVLGKGGMGEVRVCQDQRIGREVALKMLHDELSIEETSANSAKKRFEREVRIQGQLEHPGVVPVYDMGARAEGRYWFTMKRVAGQDLEAIIRGLKVGDPQISKNFNRRRLLSAFSQVCLTMAYVHSRGVIHRDLKPSNIILGAFGEVYVLDWGVAKVPGVADTDDRVSAISLPDLPSPSGSHDPIDPGRQAKTTVGKVLGTPGYMAPEQFVSSLGEPNAQSDVFSLGVILFELLTLERLIPPLDMMAVFANTIAGDFDKPSERAPEQNISPELDEICDRALSVEPEERFETAIELHEAIERYLDGVRDHQQRQKLAADHISKAKGSLQEAATADRAVVVSKARARAIGELNSALALDPGNDEAMRLIVTAYVESTGELTDEAKAALSASNLEGQRRSARIAAVGIGSLLFLLPLFLWMGVREWWVVVSYIALIVISVSTIFHSSFGGAKTTHILVMTGSFCAIAALSIVLFGPFVLLPMGVIACVLPTVVNVRARGRTRKAMFGMGIATMTLPLLLQWIGFLPTNYVWSENGLTITPWALNFPQTATEVFLVAMSVVSFVIPMMVIGPAVDALVAAERRIFAQAWSLRKLMPDEAVASVNEHLAE